MLHFKLVPSSCTGQPWWKEDHPKINQPRLVRNARDVQPSQLLPFSVSVATTLPPTRWEKPKPIYFHLFIYFLGNHLCLLWPRWDFNPTDHICHHFPSFPLCTSFSSFSSSLSSSSPSPTSHIPNKQDRCFLRLYALAKMTQAPLPL